MIRKLILGLLLCLGAPVVFAGKLTTEVDRALIAANQSFHLYIHTEANSTDEPDLSVLNEHFIIINRAHSSQLSVFNGKASSVSQWDITLIPKETGTIDIPAIQVGADTTTPITIKVSPVSADNQKATLQHVFIKTQATPSEPYVSSQILYSVKLYYDINVEGASLTEPTANNVDISRTGEPLRYEETLQGKTYQITELRYIMIPKSAGKITITPPVMIGHIQKTTTSFADEDPFFASPEQAIRVVGNKISLDILPIPKGIEPSEWLPASQLNIKESWSENPPQFQVGAPVMRTITIQAQGLKANQIPKITIPETESYKVYPDQPTLNNINHNNTVISVREQKYAIIPLKNGALIFPPIAIKWWNVEKHQLETTTLNSRTFPVNPSGVGNTNIAPVTTSSQAITETRATSPHQALAHSFLPLKTWETLCILFFIAWIGTVLAWLRQIIKTPLPADREEKKFYNNKRTFFSNDIEKKALHAIKHACVQNDARETRLSLIHWASLHWPEQRIASLNNISERLKSEKLNKQLQVLSYVLYADSQKIWQGKPLWETLALALKQEKIELEREPDALPPLYRAQAS